MPKPEAGTHRTQKQVSEKDLEAAIRALLPNKRYWPPDELFAALQSQFPNTNTGRLKGRAFSLLWELKRRKIANIRNGSWFDPKAHPDIKAKH